MKTEFKIIGKIAFEDKIGDIKIESNVYKILRDFGLYSLEVRQVKNNSGIIVKKQGDLLFCKSKSKDLLRKNKEKSIKEFKKNEKRKRLS